MQNKHEKKLTSGWGITTPTSIPKAWLIRETKTKVKENMRNLPVSDGCPLRK